MYYMQILTKYNEIKLILEDATKECERNPEYNKVRRLERKDKNVSNRI